MGLAARADTEPAVAAASRPSAPSLATALWSPRRVPALFGSAVAAAKLQGTLTTSLGSTRGCVAVDGPAGKVADVQGQLPLAGASTQKLLVGAAALAVLGAHHRFETRAVSAADVHGGTLGGDLTIVGGGDPVLSTSDVPSTAQAPNTPLSGLADAIVRAGVRRIDGSVVADDSRYDRARSVPSWKPIDISEGDVGALGALIVNGGRGDDERAVADPALDAVQALSTMLTARGVQIGNAAIDPGRAASSSASAHEIARVESPPLDAIVGQMLTVSNNETAELLTRELGVARAHEGTTAAGTRAIPAVLRDLGVPTAGVALVDGSGLSATNQITCAALLGVVGLGSQPKFAGLVRGLPIAGQTGTLAGRFLGTPLAGRLRAKTGHIDGVVGLAGLIPPAAGHHGPDYRFASLANGNFSTSEGESLQDQLAGQIGAYVDEPSAPDPIPAPR